jgi:sialic acid synthase SpsE
LLIGGGGHAKVLFDILISQDITIGAVVSPVIDQSFSLFTNVKHLKDDSEVLKYHPDEVLLVNGVGSLPGNFHKLPSLSEESNKLIARKSLVAAMDIKKGQKITADHLTCKRPGSGVSPLRYWDYLGTVAKKDYKEDDLL